MGRVKPMYQIVLVGNWDKNTWKNRARWSTLEHDLIAISLGLIVAEIG